VSGKVYPLFGQQRPAAQPLDSVWLSASAGTGKTQVLSARVIRLLLSKGVEPASLLCLTFTKAGAAEMALRVNDVLARWVRLSDKKLNAELKALGAEDDEPTRMRARALFASVLDCPGGGLRIETIHAFAQYLLSAFPVEAGVVPGAKAMEDRERDSLREEVLSEMVLSAERSGDQQVLEALATLSERKSPDGARGWLFQCADKMELWEGPGGWQAPMDARVRGLLDMPADADETWAAELCSDAHFPMDEIEACVAALQGWKAKNGAGSLEFLGQWRAASPAQRLSIIGGFRKTLLKSDGEPRDMKQPVKNDPAFQTYQKQIGDAVRAVESRILLLEHADFLTQQLELGRHFALLWDEAKTSRALVDFDDQIRRAAQLLTQKDVSAWIRYKLDRDFAHVLIDEAQDTNADQWAIIHAITDDFFSGEGAHQGRPRTIFTVGDTKQAIFGFQGTDPRNFATAKAKVKADMEALAQNAGDLRGGPQLRELQDLGLDRSFRTSEHILSFVDKAIEAIGAEAFGLQEVSKHVGEARPGLVTLWNCVRHGDEDDLAGAGERDSAAAENSAQIDAIHKQLGGDSDGSGGASGGGNSSEDDNEESWLGRHDRKLADKIALQIKRWMDDGFPLIKGRSLAEGGDGTARRAGPGDVMVLVRKRRDLAALIVARLYRYGVPVAGVDRLRLGAPLAVKDLMAALRFAAQPLDDLNLAALLVSPLGEWSQQDLLDYGYRPKQTRLWDHLRQSDAPFVAATLAKLREILRRADYESPQSLLHWLLTGPFDARRALVTRLGKEANDPIDELLNAANAYSASHTASLQGFIRWFDAGEGEVKRDPGEQADSVRVMTVHGSKGLQAPIVVLADAALDVDKPRDLALAEPVIGGEETELGNADRGREIPLPLINKHMRVGPIAKAYDKALASGTQEHWRLLYVAMTRAEEALFITGSLGKSQSKKGVPPEDSWFARLQPLFGDEAVSDDLWGSRWVSGEPCDAPYARDEKEPAGDAAVLPDWLLKSAPEEPKPPKPLAPSGLGEDEGSDPPITGGAAASAPKADERLAEAARRGVLIHGLLERLPDVAPARREALARHWLEKQAPELDEAERAAMTSRALSVLEAPEMAEVFSPDALAEIPLSAKVGDQVITGIADRLLVTPEKVIVADFKTARRPPHRLEDIPPSTVRQMAAYVAALSAIYPAHKVEAAVIYTQTPQLFRLPDGMLAEENSRFSDQQESLGLPELE
jgi:ATP-dependent helicase/nuclease subunit A